jgi:hypothetical protein
LGGGYYELLQRCGLERYPYVGVFKQICNSSYFGAVIGERVPNFIAYLLVMGVISLILYVLVKFLE